MRCVTGVHEENMQLNKTQVSNVSGANSIILLGHGMTMMTLILMITMLLRQVIT